MFALFENKLDSGFKKYYSNYLILKSDIRLSLLLYLLKKNKIEL